MLTWTFFQPKIHLNFFTQRYVECRCFNKSHIWCTVTALNANYHCLTRNKTCLAGNKGDLSHKKFLVSCECTASVHSQVLVSSDKRPHRNLTFHNVSARQGSYCNRTRLNSQTFALRDMKIVTHDGRRLGQKMSYHSSFCWLISFCNRRNISFNVLEL